MEYEKYDTWDNNMVKISSIETLKFMSLPIYYVLNLT